MAGVSAQPQHRSQISTAVVACWAACAAPCHPLTAAGRLHVCGMAAALLCGPGTQPPDDLQQRHITACKESNDELFMTAPTDARHV